MGEIISWIIIALFGVAEVIYFFVIPTMEQKGEIDKKKSQERIEFERERLSLEFEKVKLRKEQDMLLLFERKRKLDDLEASNEDDSKKRKNKGK